MLQPAELSLEEMGDLAEVIPAADPEVKLTYRPIPQFGQAPRRSIIPVCEPTLGGNEMKYVQQAIETNWISSAGRFIRDFEARFAEICGVKYGIACANGTVAMHLAMATLGLEPGDEVIIPTFTMIATANAVTYCGAKPVLVDMDPGYWQMDLNHVEAKITPRTKAIVPVHIYGHPTDMDPLMALAEKHGLMVIEDAAEAHGAEYKGRRTGGLGHAAGFSFYGNKIITTGEGGMVTTNDRELAQLAWNLRDHAFSHERHFWHKFVGFNYRMTNLQAAVGLAQVEQLDGFVAARRRNAAEYNCRLHGIPGIRTPAEAPWAKNVYWMYGIMVDEAEYGMSRDALRRVLADHGIETRTFFIPMHCQPVYWQQFKGERYPVAEDLCKRGFYLPSASSLSIDEIEYVTDVIRNAAK
ncbi:MAG: DegT/DnrJ/EryC1/StrS family aminotransferase [Caldilinea sp.]|nr:DegT/DnrJ/EryC1/StrS family aminotransferase [Caldilineaceae bacterium]MCB9122562.1 DegT/DnrJ/EryC1/StrS family aminotransferase [Caldilineaceae bacterium]MCB9124762.1 DegT/DnrJ/EryC1/StrS family aminotransferase [Caldilineaceae bacterium]MCO5214219.1 DegT/DnrJ/EryC1/StrS family aminotransferase [Caldilinea sp.]